MRRALVFFILAVNFYGCNAQSDEIILVNVERYDRAHIAKLISLLCSFDPRVISIDIQFKESLGGNDDRNLVKALWSCNRLVLPSLIESHNGQIFVSSANATEFVPVNSKFGYVSAKVMERDLHIPKQFVVQTKDELFEEPSYHFSVMTAMSYDSLKVISFIKSNLDSVDVDFRRSKRLFKRFTATELVTGKFTKKEIEGKIVMIGYLGPDNIDKFYSPLNRNMKKPDMYGLEYLATIVAQILDK